MTFKAHFDGRAIVPDDPISLPVGTQLKVHIEVVTAAAPPPVPRVFRPLDIQIDPELSKAIAEDPEFNPQ
jgi:hypothetical protein